MDHRLNWNFYITDNLLTLGMLDFTVLTNFLMANFFSLMLSEITRQHFTDNAELGGDGGCTQSSQCRVVGGSSSMQACPPPHIQPAGWKFRLIESPVT